MKKLPVNRADSGWSWVVVFASSFTTFLIFGTAKCEGLLYRELPVLYGVDRTVSATISTTKISTMSIIGLGSGMLCNYISCRKLVFIAGIFACLAFTVCAFAPDLSIFMIGYGGIYGMSNGLAAIPARIVVTKYCVKRRTLGLGLSLTGSCFGGIVIPPLFEKLIDWYGLQQAMFVMGAFLLHTCACALVYFPLAKRRTSEPAEETISETIVDDSHPVDKCTAAATNGISALKNNISDIRKSISMDRTHSVSLCHRLGKSLCKETMVLSNPRFFVIAVTAWSGHAFVISINMFLPDYAMTEGIGEISRAQAVSLISCFAVGDLVGRLFMTWLSSKRWIPLNFSFATTLLINSVLLFTLPFVHSYVGLLIASFLVGFPIGAGLLMPTFLFTHYLPSEQWPSAYGFTSVMFLIPSWIAPILGGIREKTGSYATPFFILSGLALCFSVTWWFESLLTYKNKRGSYHVSKESLDRDSLQHDDVIGYSLSFTAYQ